jgi:hypothetical protein
MKNGRKKSRIARKGKATQETQRRKSRHAAPLSSASLPPPSSASLLSPPPLPAPVPPIIEVSLSFVFSCCFLLSHALCLTQTFSAVLQPFCAIPPAVLDYCHHYRPSPAPYSAEQTPMDGVEHQTWPPVTNQPSAELAKEPCRTILNSDPSALFTDASGGGCPKRPFGLLTSTRMG